MLTFSGGPMISTTRFPIKFETGYALLSRSLFLSPSSSYVELANGEVRVQMGWAFRATFERARISRAYSRAERIPLTRGVHGWGGRWLVNGAGDGILVIDLEPKQRAYVMGFPVSLRQVLVSVDDPAAVAATLAS
jgi:hypothetical protein